MFVDLPPTLHGRCSGYGVFRRGEYTSDLVSQENKSNQQVKCYFLLTAGLPYVRFCVFFWPMGWGGLGWGGLGWGGVG